MPCDSIRSTTVELGKVDTALLAAAFAALGIHVYSHTADTVSAAGVNYRNGQITTTYSAAEAQAFTKRVKQSYAAEVVKSQAKKFGWQLKKTGAFKYEVTKGSV